MRRAWRTGRRAAGHGAGGRDRLAPAVRRGGRPPRPGGGAGRSSRGSSATRAADLAPMLSRTCPPACPDAGPATSARARYRMVDAVAELLAGRVPPARRSCSSSTTCTGPTSATSSLLRHVLESRPERPAAGGGDMPARTACRTAGTLAEALQRLDRGAACCGGSRSGASTTPTPPRSPRASSAASCRPSCSRRPPGGRRQPVLRPGAAAPPRSRPGPPACSPCSRAAVPTAAREVIGRRLGRPRRRLPAAAHDRCRARARVRPRAAGAGQRPCRKAR